MSVATRRIAAAAAAAVLIPSLAGCWSGGNAATSQQANQPVGNGVNLTTGDVQVRGALWVRSELNPSEATLVASFVNNGETPDTLTKVEIQPAADITLTADAIEVPTAGIVRTGYLSRQFVNATGFNALPSAFVTTTFTFQNAGSVTGDLLTVQNVGQYAGVPVSARDQKTFLAEVEQATETPAE